MFRPRGDEGSIRDPEDASDSLFVHRRHTGQLAYLPVPDGQRVVVVFPDGEQFTPVGRES